MPESFQQIPLLMTRWTAFLIFHHEHDSKSSFADAICELDVAKATGPACIPSIALNICSPELSPVLAKLYNKCLFGSCFTSCWKFSSVVPAYKNDGEISDPGNCRPIGLFLS